MNEKQCKAGKQAGREGGWKERYILVLGYSEEWILTHATTLSWKNEPKQSLSQSGEQRFCTKLKVCDREMVFKQTACHARSRIDSCVHRMFVWVCIAGSFMIAIISFCLAFIYLEKGHRSSEMSDSVPFPHHYRDIFSSACALQVLKSNKPIVFFESQSGWGS